MPTTKPSSKTVQGERVIGSAEVRSHPFAGKPNLDALRQELLGRVEQLRIKREQEQTQQGE